MKEIDEIIGQIKIRNREYELSIDKDVRKKGGCYYTSFDLTIVMVEELCGYINHNIKKDTLDLKLLEPCVGTGNFVFTYLSVIANKIKTQKDFERVLNNIYVADVDENALEIYKKNLTYVATELFDFEISEAYFDSHIAQGLLFDLNSSSTNIISLRDAFGLPNNYFDVVITNPPYKNLKAERSHYITQEEKEFDKSKYAAISEESKKHFKYSVSGTINIYKLFVEAIVEDYLTDKGVCSLLIPSSILSDKSCEKLRGRIIEEYKIISIKTISEQSNFVDAQQALCALLLNKHGSTTNIKVSKDFDKSQELIDINIDTAIINKSEKTLSILTQNEYEVLQQLKVFPTIKELPFIFNLRGELDLTQGKKYITSEYTNYKLIKGRNISLYKTTSLDDAEYISPEFLGTTAKLRYIKSNRIACQQISNQHKEKRVIFAPIEKNHILGNSCNFITIDPNEHGIDSYWLMGILNSDLINWYFKLSSSNNHINNYEIDNFPIPLYSENKNQIKDMVLEYLSSFNDDILDKLDSLVMDAYGLSPKDNTVNEYDFKNNIESVRACFEDLIHIIPTIKIYDVDRLMCDETLESFLMSNRIELSKFNIEVAKSIIDKYTKLAIGGILNHTSFKLSELDLEMIENIPQGGSWKDIAPETVAKSKRLLRITETGGRTTLYGRIDYSKPSYTITTYFNRPGNGTYVHPIHNRVLSVREASRFQSFPDNYYFYGNKTQLLKQVGNAVPPLFAYQLGEKIKTVANCKSSLDLFCGAGGMTCGFKMGGINSVIATDIEQSACITIKSNNPETEVICGDITDSDVKQNIIDLAKVKNIDIVCGGPPCQGFSMAGFRDVNDPRNNLFRDFVDIVSAVNPKVIVFENVDGILTLEKGKTYREILSLFSELGYNTLGQTLFAHHYAVPQKRKRVIIICTRKDLNIFPSDLFPPVTISDEEEYVSAKDVISDLENVMCDENSKYNNTIESEYLTWLKSKITSKQFLSNFNKAPLSEEPLQMTLF